MSFKKKVVMKASVDKSEKESIINFNKVLITIVKNKLEKPVGKRELIKVVGYNKIKVIIEPVKNKVKVTYTINSETSFSKQFSKIEDFESSLKEVEDKL